SPSPTSLPYTTLFRSDFQVSADDPLARDQQGLHLMAQRQERKAPDGSVRRGVKTWHQLTAAQYDRIKTAGEENQLEVDGRQTLRSEEHTSELQSRFDL